MIDKQEIESMEKYYNQINVSDSEYEFFNNFCFEIFKDFEGGMFIGHPFLFLTDDQIMKCLIVCNRGIYYFYDTSEDKNIYKRFIMQQLLQIDSLSERVMNDFDSMLFPIKIGDSSFALCDSEILTKKEVNDAISVFQNVYNLTKKDKRQLTAEDTIGSMIVERSNREAVLDSEQFKFIYNENYSDCNIRVRGLAGCGKTILLAKKMAFLHFKDNQKKMAYVFYTKSLKQSIDAFFVQFYRQFNKSPDENTVKNIHIMHGWGTRQYPGLYSRLCKTIGIENSPFTDDTSFENLCNDMIKYIEENNLRDKVELYDYIFIDEAQDFGINFFKLAKMCLKPTGKLIYAYDELQVLNDIKSGVPSKEDIFGADKCEDIDLSDCYRTPLEILVTAHALGLGIYHFNDKNQQEMINVVQDNTVWNAIGYINRKDPIRGGKEVSFYRKQIIDNPLLGEAVQCNIYQNFAEQCQFIITEITRLINNEDVRPEDILIIDLDSRSLNDDYSTFMFYLDEYLKKNDMIDSNKKRAFEVSIINKESGYSFKEKDKAAYTTIFRAKGNEANIVFIINANNNDAILTYNRNRIFTAMTRAKFKVYICGAGKLMKDIINEIDLVKQHNFCLDFIYPTQEEIRKHKHRIYQENRLTKTVDDLFRELDKNGAESTSEELYDILMSKFTEKEKELFIKKLKQNEENKNQ